ncbi:peptidylprolyl isomerase [Parasedimentitalea psychrophila]|uniref:Parvulin-like PPIase n=1 Tax=Parasedimentitalea psychrophila TaxID=2997337 RepID=A0A9Y2L160_9RHOB|nr:peptidylprolyl isomerase [Parasedimentitalea psychrophila]WIY24964.1 peptidylprolyl isomerase [Parasedimentitalea psychrophila]
MQQFLKSWFSAPDLVRGTIRLTYTALFLGAAVIVPQSTSAQGLFSPAVTVNESVITKYELEQRTQFMRLLGTPGDPNKRALEDLINDRLQKEATAQAGITLSEDAITLGMTEFAGRANLTLEEFLKALGENDVAPETLRDYTIAGLSWRDYVGSRFLSLARPSEGEIDRAMGRADTGGVQVLLSEVIIPINEQNVGQVKELAEQISQLDSFSAFSSAATQYSAADSRNNQGHLPWVSLTKLPPQLQEVVLALNAGEITSPLQVQGAIALFQMRDVREVAGAAPRFAAIEYASYLIAGGHSPQAQATAQQLAAQIDTCDDLYGIAKDQDPAVLEIQSLAPAEIPLDVALELAKLDSGETSAVLTRNNGQTLVLLMMCGRTADLGTDEDDGRQGVANALTQQRLEAYAASFIEQLRADAEIVIK